MPARPLRYLTAMLMTVILSACSSTGGNATPEPDYSVVQGNEPFEVRDYPELVVVQTPMNGGDRGAFGRLFDYISGTNEGAREIAMTAPVIQSPKGEEIAMTAPVLMKKAEDGADRQMIFVLPETFTIDTAPVPTDPAVTLSTIPARRVATVQFSGRMTDDAVATQRARLMDWMQTEGLAAVGPAETAGYDAPWVLPPFRRNEVLIPVAAR